MNQKITKMAFLGLGVMGGPMARHVAMKAGAVGLEKLTVYNRHPQKMDEWQDALENPSVDIHLANSVEEAVKDQDLVCACLGNDASVREVILETAFPAMKEGAIFADHTTISANTARDLYQAAKKRNFSSLDAPITGGQAGAENGQLCIMVGGDEDAFQKAKPLMESYGKLVERIGEGGTGQSAKMVNQVAIAGLLQALSEAIYLGETMEIDMVKVLNVIGGGGAQSWQMNNRGYTMLERKFDFGFQIKWMVKDLTICLEEAKRLGIELPITKIVEAYYEQLMTSDGGKGARMDTSALIKLLDKQVQKQ